MRVYLVGDAPAVHGVADVWTMDVWTKGYTSAQVYLVGDAPAVRLVPGHGGHGHVGHKADAAEGLAPE